MEPQATGSNCCSHNDLIYLKLKTLGYATKTISLVCQIIISPVKWQQIFEFLKSSLNFTVPFSFIILLYLFQIYLLHFSVIVAANE